MLTRRHHLEADQEDRESGGQRRPRQELSLQGQRLRGDEGNGGQEQPRQHGQRHVDDHGNDDSHPGASNDGAQQQLHEPDLHHQCHGGNDEEAHVPSLKADSRRENGDEERLNGVQRDRFTDLKGAQEIELG